MQLQVSAVLIAPIAPVLRHSPGSPLQGVRSLQLHGHLLSAGSSMSALSFLDLRMRAWLAVDGPKPRPIQTQVDDYSVSRADKAITALQASLLGYVLVPVCFWFTKVSQAFACRW